MILKRCHNCLQFHEYLRKSNPWHYGPRVKLPTLDLTILDCYTTNKEKTEKLCVFLFICLTVRAIHLDSVEDMTAEQFLAALCRFITRRSEPDQIILDNAPHFKATKNAVGIT